MNINPSRDIDETKAFVFDILVGVGGLISVGYVGYEMGAFAGVTDTIPFIAIASGRYSEPVVWR